MRAKIIVRHTHNRTIAHIFDVESIDDVSVDSAVHTLARQYPSDRYVIDKSQIALARESLKVA